MSLDADRMMRKLQQLPITQSLQKGAVKLPAVTAPSLDGLVMTVVTPQPPSADELAGRFAMLLREHGTWRERALGEPVALGDDLWVDLVGYVGGKLMPGGVKLDWQFELADDESLLGLSEQLVGVPVGSTAVVTVELGPKHPNVALRGARAEMLIELHRAFEVAPLDGEDVRPLGRGDSMEAVMQSIADELIQLNVDAAWVAAEKTLLDEVAERSSVEVSDALVDEELRRRWGAAEGVQLSARGFDADEQQEALELWLTSPEARAEVRSRLKLALVLKAIAERDNVVPDATQIEAIMLASAAPFGFENKQQLQEAVKAEKSAGRAMVEVAYQQQLIGYVLERAEVREA